MKEILIQIKQRFIEPTLTIDGYTDENYKGYDYRNAWRLVGKVDYNESLQLFSFIKNESQLAYWLLNKYGKGEYNLLAWCKNQKGFWLFLHLQCYEDYYVRIAKKQQPMTQQIRDELRQYRRLERDFNDTSDDDERLHIKAKINDLEKVKDYFNCKNETRGYKEWIQIISTELKPTNYMEYGIVPNEQSNENTLWDSNNFVEPTGELNVNTNFDTNVVDTQEYQEPKQDEVNDEFKIW